MRSNGFSLVEMAVVLAIVGLLMAGLLPMISGQIEQQRRTETRKLMEDIRMALIGYAITQTPPRLPCPAQTSIATGSTGAGEEYRTGTACNLTTGVLPWVTLGVNEADAWGRRFTYSVPSTFSNSASGVLLTSASTISVLSSNGGTAVASGVAAVIVSHGMNGYGAYTPQGGSALSTTGAGTDEANNADGNTTFVSHETYPDFDDIVIWLSPNTLFNRLVAAGKLP